MTSNPPTRWALVLAIALLPLGVSQVSGPPDALATMGREEPKIAEPTAAGDKPSSSNPLSGKPEAITEGHGLYVKFCAPCHGPHADGESRFGKYAADLRKFSLGYSQFVITVQNGRTGKQMPPWKEYLTPEQISQIGAYLETLAIEGAFWR